MRAILIRHGNTFAAGEPSRAVGIGEDVPLVEKGEAQAAALGEALRGTPVARVLTSPMKRCRQMAQIIRDKAGVPEATVENRLGELDYGDWAMKTDAEVDTEFGIEARQNWRDSGLWPVTGNWGGSPEAIRQEIEGLLGELADEAGEETVLLVSHGGRGRFFHEVLMGDRTKSLKTGQAAVFERNGGRWQVLAWDIPADKLKEVI